MQWAVPWFPGRVTPWNAVEGRPQHQRAVIENVVMLILLCISGHVLFTEGDQGQTGLVAAAVIFTGLLEWRRRFSVGPAFVVAVMVFAVIHAWQAVSFRYVPLVSFVAFFMRLYVAYAAVCLVRDFPRTYVKVMFIMCLMSFCFYVPDQLCRAAGIDFRACFEILHRLIGAELGYRYDIGLHNFQISRPYRNAAFFWEPGAFAGFTLVAIVFLALVQPRLKPREYRGMLLVFCIAILTTCSTMGYMVLPVALLLHVRTWISLSRKKMQMGLLLLSLAPAACLVGTSAWKLEFMSKKIKAELQSVELGEFTGQSFGRLSSALFHLPYIKERPIAGWGKNVKTYLALDPYIDTSLPAGNGLLRFVHEMGLAGLFTYLLLTAGSFYSLTSRHLLETTVIMMVVVLTLQGEEFLTGGVYLAFMFLQDRGHAPVARGSVSFLAQNNMVSVASGSGARRRTASASARLFV